jgi:hypothetical protein
VINIHLNGDIVRCPDIAAIHKRAAEIRDQHGICKYNFHENQCSTWLIAVRTHKYSGRCIFAGCPDCPGHKFHTKTGKKEKTFKIDDQVYRKVSSAGHYLIKKSKPKTLFLCLTFPEFKKKVSDDEINKRFSKYVENLRKNYDCGGYIAVREYGEEKGRIHFHLLLSISFVDFRILNDAWCHSIKDICHYSKNALTSDPETRFIYNPVTALRYVCKYISKAKGQVSTSRLVFISNNIIQKAFQYTGNVRDFLTGYKSITFRQTSDYTTAFRINDANEFYLFCKKFLYPLFELSDEKPEYLYVFPINSS